VKLLLLCLVFTANFAFAQQQHRTPVYFGCTCDDTVGSLYATQFRDLLASSPRYRSVSSTKQGKLADGEYYWQVSVVTIDPENGDPGHHTAIGVVILIGNAYFVTQYTQFCSRERAADCAANTLADLDKEVSK
jgi:hypothetical protein